ncbi:Cysteine/Histidine-rich C1 domain family protein [Rhynchospora pubera]|uniref:Cysteine/Histidine-rich C1 domain family protein n=1 Tax=Rhynchospora pubera TaxID=906938 RepID=A0AAV8CB43_9POAL|nr:Cysteine/Histidine-rich C1 domain family protein [Rhynchospora pubera]
MESINDAEKTLIHISHLHPLKLVASPEPRPVCHACHIQCGVQCYGCTKCRYFLHIICATAKKDLNHPAHPDHTLTFELTPPYPSGKFSCYTCGVEGTKFCFSCKECNYNLHLDCSSLPHSVNSHSHSHPLILTYKNPFPSGTTGICDLCENYVDPCKWFYLCRNCDFLSHIGCLPEAMEALLPDMPIQPVMPRPRPQGGPQPPGNAATAMDNLQMQQLLSAQAQMQSLMAVNAQLQAQQLMSAQASMGQSLMFTNANLHSMWKPNYDSIKDSI